MLIIKFVMYILLKKKKNYDIINWKLGLVCNVIIVYVLLE